MNKTQLDTYIENMKHGSIYIIDPEYIVHMTKKQLDNNQELILPENFDYIYIIRNSTHLILYKVDNLGRNIDYLNLKIKPGLDYFDLFLNLKQNVTTTFASYLAMIIHTGSFCNIDDYNSRTFKYTAAKEKIYINKDDNDYQIF